MPARLMVRDHTFAGPMPTSRMTEHSRTAKVIGVVAKPASLCHGRSTNPSRVCRWSALGRRTASRSTAIFSLMLVVPVPLNPPLIRIATTRMLAMPVMIVGIAMIVQLPAAGAMQMVNHDKAGGGKRTPPRDSPRWEP